MHCYIFPATCPAARRKRGSKAPMRACKASPGRAGGGRKGRRSRFQSAMPAAFADLDPRLAADSVFVADLPLCQVRLMDDAAYPWLLLIPRRPGAVEIAELAREDRVALMDEIAFASAALRAETACHKLNVAALGNVVPQLHVHVIARFRGDAAWPGPVWGRAPARPYDAAARQALVAALAARLSAA